MPNRILREGIIDSRAVNALSEPAEILYRRLISIVDDFGRYDAAPDLIRARCFPLQLERWPISRVLEYTEELHESGLVTVYRRGSKTFVEIANFGQRVQSKERYPGPSLAEKERRPTPRTTESHGEPPRTTESHGEPPRTTESHGEPPRTTESHGEPPLNCVTIDTNGANAGTYENPRRTTENHGESPCRASRARTNTNTNTESDAKSETNPNTATGNGGGGGSAHRIFQPSAKFEDWWRLWSSVRGTNHRGQAMAKYSAIVPTVAELDCFECTASYLQSLDNPSRGYHPENFLTEQAKDKFQARWPASRNGNRTASVDELAEMIDNFRRTRDEL